MKLTSSHWGTYNVHVKKGKIERLEPFLEDSNPSNIANGIINIIDDNLRIKSPMVRKSWLKYGPGYKNSLRGNDDFIEISWEKANELVARELKKTIKNHGNSSIYAGSYGWASAGRFHHALSQLHRFMNCIGGYTSSVDTYSFAAAEVVVPHILGSFRDYIYNQTSWDSIIKDTDLFVCFGGMPLKNGQIGQGGTGKHIQKNNMILAKKAGVKFVNISPCNDDILSDLKSEWIAIIPNTDTALILALCYVLLKKNLYDKDFIKKYTVGSNSFFSYLLGKKDGIIKNEKWASKICKIEEVKITKLAESMVSKRTMISLSWSLTRQQHGEQPYWAGIALASMIGQIGVSGGGFGFGYSAVNTVGNNLMHYKFPSFPQKKNPVSDFIPVARFSDMLLNPNKKINYNGKVLVYPDIKIVYWAGGNPFHHHQDINKMIKAWKKPETIIINDWCWNTTAKFADIILPCTTTFERDDISISGHDNYIVSMEKAIQPIGLAKDDYEIFSNLASLMGVNHEFTEGKKAKDWQEKIYDECRKILMKGNKDIPMYDEFRKKKWFKIKKMKGLKIMLKEFRQNPIKNSLKTPSGKIEIFSKKIKSFDYINCPPHPSWLEPYEWLGNKKISHKFHLISNQPREKLHSQYDHGDISKSLKINQRQTLLINIDDAKDMKIKNKDIVKVYNKRGSCICSVILSKSIVRNVLMLPTGAWFSPENYSSKKLSCNHGNPNILTPDIGTSDLAQGPSAHSCLVSLKKINKTSLKKLKVFNPPKIIKYYN